MNASPMRRIASTSETVVNVPTAKDGQGLDGGGDDQASRPPQAASDKELINILIVDDEPKNLTVLETILNDPTYRLVKAGSADQALLALLVDQFALLILDIRMPGVTGIELARMIKERKKTSQIPIIFLTAYYNEDQHVLEGYGAGAVDYLHKPVNPDILRSKVAVFAELYRMQREIKAANFALLAEVSERRSAQEQLRELNNTLEQHVAERTREVRAGADLLRTTTDNASVGLATLDLERRYVFANPAYCKIFSLQDEIAGKHIMELLQPVCADQISPLLNKAYAGERSAGELRAPSMHGRRGRSSHYSIVCEPERDAGSSVVGVVLVMFDITDRKRSEEQIRLLLREVNHRSRNTLSVVAAIARQTRASNQKEFVRRFSDRIQALAASHDLLAKSEWRSIDLSELVRTQLAHFKDLVGQRIVLDGPPLNLSVAGAQSIGMVVHELATNAAKHGALFNEVGRVNITWKLTGADRDNRFAMSWIERGGPSVVAPTRRGYGSTVIQGMVELSLGGEVQLDFSTPGLLWQLQCPVTKILEMEDELDVRSE